MLTDFISVYLYIFTEQEDLLGFHGKPVSKAAKDNIISHLQSLIKDQQTKLSIPAPTCQSEAVNISNIQASSAPDYEKGKPV